MTNEHILQWLAEFGMGEAQPIELAGTTWANEFGWSNAYQQGYLNRTGNYYYSLSDKAIKQLDETLTTKE